MSIQITNMSELEEAFIMQSIDVGVMLSKRRELERVSTTYHIQVHLFRNYITAVISSSNYASSPFSQHVL